MRGLGFLCQPAAAGDTELRLAQSNWTGLRAPDAARDDLYLFTDGDPYDDDDDTWTLVDAHPRDPLGHRLRRRSPGLRADRRADPAEVMPAQHPGAGSSSSWSSSSTREDGEWWLGARSVHRGAEPPAGARPIDRRRLRARCTSTRNGNPTADKAAIKSIRLDGARGDRRCGAGRRLRRGGSSRGRAGDSGAAAQLDPA